MLFATACANTALGVLFTAVGDAPQMDGLDDWARLALSMLSTMLGLRNLLLSMYDMCSDNLATYPILNPTLLKRPRGIVAVRPRGLIRLSSALHVTSCVQLYLVTGLVTLSDSWHILTKMFMANLAAKLLIWQLYQYYQAWMKKCATVAAAGEGKGPGGRKCLVFKNKRLNFLRRL